MKQREFIPNSETALDRCGRWLTREIISRTVLNEKRTRAIEYAIVELLNNAYEHGNLRDLNKTVMVEWEVSDRGIILSVKDEGEGFIPRIPEALPSKRQLRGRGLCSVRADVQSMTLVRVTE